MKLPHTGKKHIPILALTSLAVCFAQAAEEQPASSIQIPIQINLDAVESEANKQVPDVLENIDMRGHTCVEAKWLKTKGLPKCSMKGIKIYCKDRWIKTKTTPSISCDVNGWVKRNGKINISGSGPSFDINIPLRASVTAKGRGAIGKNIQQTVNAATVVSAKLTPSISENWEPTLNVQTSYRWTKRPEIKLFNLIPVTISSHIDPVMKKELEKLNNSIPGLLKDAEIRQKVEDAWLRVQEPQLVEQDSNSYIHFTPIGIGMSDLSTKNNILTASFRIEGYPKLTIGEKPRVVETVPLPALQKVASSEAGINVRLPIAASYDRLSKLGGDHLSELGEIDLADHGFDGTLEIKDFRVASKSGKLELTASMIYDNNSSWISRIDIFDWLDVKGMVSFEAVPNVDSDKNILSLAGVDFDLSSSSTLADVLVDIARLPFIKSLIVESLEVNFTSEINKQRELIGKALNRKVSDQLTSSGSVDSLSIGNPSVEKEKIAIPVLFKGQSELRVGI